MHVSVKNIHVTGFAGPLLSIANVTGKGLEGATTVDAPKVPPAIEVKETYKLH